MRSFASVLSVLCLGVLKFNVAHANVHCGTATVGVGDSKSVEHYCYDDGVIPTPGGGGGPPSSGGGGGGTSDGVGRPPSVMMQKHEVKCATAYGKYGPKPGVIVTFSNEWGWASTKDDSVIETDISVPPPPDVGYGWVGLYGNTVITEPMATSVYMDSYNSVANTINTLAHEFAHQNDVAMKESDAEAIGNAAQKAYEADTGAKCSGP